MAIVEQLVYGNRPDGQPGRTLLATSPDLEAECAQEVVRLCEGWGAVPDDGLRRAALLAFPLESRTDTLPGELYAVIRISQGLRPVYHAVILNARDYQDFDLNPFALVHEGAFLDEWSTGRELARRTITASSLAPLVTPPPGPADVGSVDEAVRQVLANARLLLPLELASSDSDRFLALVVAGLPRAVRRRMRFASWAPSGTNRYTLAATHRESAIYSAWQPFLMTCLTGELDAECTSYLDDLRLLLGNGDLTGIERLSRETRAAVSRVRASVSHVRERTLSATVDETTTRKLKQRGEAPSRTTTKATTRQSVAQPATGARAPQRSRPSRALARRPHHRPVLARSGRVRRGFAVVLSLAILAAGGYYFWHASHWSRLPGLSALGEALDARTEHGVVSVGAVYRAALDDVSRAGLPGSDEGAGVSRQRGADLLRQAGQLLAVQARDYLQDGGQTLIGEARDRVPPAPADRLQSRGRVLASELRRLALARTSLATGTDWRDLADLDDRRLAARFDSLVARRDTPTQAGEGLRDLELLLRRVEVTTRQVASLARIEALLATDHCGTDWSARLQTAVDDLAAVRQGRARQLRDDALALARLKRAEQASAFSTWAYRWPPDAAGELPPPVADVLPALDRRLESRTGEPPPALLVGTIGFYRTLAEAARPDLPASRLTALVGQLRRNRAVAADPATYGDHVSRLEFRRDVGAATAKTAETADIADIAHTGEPAPRSPDERQRVLQALESGATEARWRELAGSLTDSFLARWAGWQTRRLADDRRSRQEAYAAARADLSADREALMRCLAGGGRCGALWSELAARLSTLRARWGLDPASDEPDTRALAALAARLAATPPLQLQGVTVRLDQSHLDDEAELVVTLRAGGEPPLVSDRIRVGPAAPASSGWVGTTSVDWTVVTRPGLPLTLTVSHADRTEPLARVRCDRWLRDWDPQDLGGLDVGAGVRVSLHRAAPYWGDVSLPALTP